jgi:hypothetical protein
MKQNSADTVILICDSSDAKEIIKHQLKSHVVRVEKEKAEVQAKLKS